MVKSTQTNGGMDQSKMRKFYAKRKLLGKGMH